MFENADERIRVGLLALYDFMTLTLLAKEINFIIQCLSIAEMEFRLPIYGYGLAATRTENTWVRPGWVRRAYKT
jgi:hypothetical protein